MARVYELNKQAALESGGGSNYINKTGKYVGIIINCYYDINQNGTESVNIIFESNESQEAPLLTIYTHNNKGEELAGYNLFNAIMTCCKVKKTSWQKEQIEVYNFTSKQREKQVKETCVELKNKPVGLLLREEEYQNQQGETKTKVSLFAPFEANTELMANEILTGMDTPISLGKAVEWLTQNPVKKLKVTGYQQPRTQNQASQQFQQPNNQQRPQQQPNFDDFDDDIPF